MAHWKVNEIRLCAMRNVDQTFCPKLLSAEHRQTFIAPVFIKIILMSLNEHCLHLFNCLLGSLFIYVYLTFKLPTPLVVFRKVAVKYFESDFVEK
jgi:hypothetical protein